MIRPCTPGDFEAIYQIINDAAQAYRGVIPPDRWHEPYMPREELREALDDGVMFHGYEQEGRLLGVMGIQHVQDVTLIRHAYVQTAHRSRGIGSQLLSHLRGMTDRPVLIGTWADAGWAVRFYRKHGFELIGEEEKIRLLRKYWGVPQRQIESSVVLADSAWARHAGHNGKEQMNDVKAMAQKDGFARLLGMEVVETGRGFAKARMRITADHLNGMGMPHGGAIFSLADFVFALTCNSYGPPAVAVNVNISYLKAPAPGTTLTADGVEVSDGKMGTCTVRVTDEKNTLVALFQGLCYRKTPPQAGR